MIRSIANFGFFMLGLGVLIFIGALLYLKLNKKEYMPYEKTELLSAYEKKCFRLLISNAECYNMYVITKVRIADLVKTTNKSERMKYFSKISQKHFDFVILDKITYNVLALVELDDSSHNSRNNQIKDKFKDDLAVEIGIPLFRIKNLKNEEINSIYKTLTRKEDDINE